MVDSSWDNSGLPPVKRGMPTWGKVLLGCGVVAVLGIGALFVVGFRLAQREMSKPEVQAELVKALWPYMKRVASDLATDEGSRDVFRRHPRLVEQFANEDRFLERVRSWRDDLALVPDAPPGPDQVQAELTLSMLTFRCRLSNGHTFVVRWKGRSGVRRGEPPIVGLDVVGGAQR